MYVLATLNNTLVTIADDNGKTLCWSSTGAVGFKGSRKATPYASSIAIETAMNKAKTMGVNQLSVFIKGPGPGREAALRFLRNAPFKITQLADVTPLPHNGTRQPKQRRV
jgi:small subunit ribosomal protein S11